MTSIRNVSAWPLQRFSSRHYRASVARCHRFGFRDMSKNAGPFEPAVGVLLRSLEGAP